MSFRGRLLVLFTVFGVVPIIALGVHGYFQSLEPVEDLIRERTGAVAERLAGEITTRFELLESDFLLFTENAETQRLYRAIQQTDSVERSAARSSATAYLDQAWRARGSSYRTVIFRDTDGAVVLVLGDSRFADAGRLRPGAASPEEDFTAVRPIRDEESGEIAGSLEARVRVGSAYVPETFAAAFGQDGYSVIVDREERRVVAHPRRGFLRRPLSDLLGQSGWDQPAEILDDASGSFLYEADGSRHVASFISLTLPPWSVIATASVDEFVAPFARARAINLGLVIALAMAISVAFLFVLRRMTRSLSALTVAADQVAGGDLSPHLPPGGPDEIGRLATAFGLMVHQVGEMLQRVRESRHMAAVGKFASQISHEIRNPLTSIKLNLQRLERGARSGRIPDSYAEPVEICLDEVRRLDGVVRGVLSMAQTPPTVATTSSVHTAIETAIQVLSPQFEELGVAIRTTLDAPADLVAGDSERLRGVFLNLLLNAVEASAAGGTVHVSTSEVAQGGAGWIRIRVADDGPGVRRELREKIFEPFFTTKTEGTGFGLALAQQSVEELTGKLRLERADATEPGAVFTVELPLSLGESPATSSPAGSNQDTS